MDSNNENIIQKYANALVTYSNCNGHRKGDMNKEKIKEYAAKLSELGIPLPNDVELFKIGIFNGEGAF